MKLIWLLLHNLGESRGFAFVEFSSIDEAREWIEAEQVYTNTRTAIIWYLDVFFDVYIRFLKTKTIWYKLQFLNTILKDLYLFQNLQSTSKTNIPYITFYHAVILEIFKIVLIKIISFI